MPHTLLLADDSLTIQRVIELTFADEDVQVVAVSDGSEAIAVLDRTPPDIVLADVGMPGQNGYAVARHIRNTPSLAHIPVVLLTGAFEPIDQAKVAEVGCDGVLAKPFEPQLVIARVKELLARPRTGTESAEAAASSPVADEIMRAPLAVVENIPRREDIDSYFDRLDEAFTRLPGPATPDMSRAQVESEAPAFDRSASAPAREAEASPAVPVSFPPLADAFAALLAAEQTSPAPAHAPVWPIAAPAAPARPDTPSLAISDDLVEQVTRRVLEQLTDRVVRETTAGIVSGVAERLVKEEIQRLKDSIPG